MSERIVATSADGVSILTPDMEEVEALERIALDNGRQRVMPAARYAAVSDAARATFCVRNGLYGLVTQELVEFLQEQIKGRTALEIGAGDGVLAEALCIPGVDNHMQHWQHVRATYALTQQPIVRYGANVVNMDGMEAMVHYRPQVVIGNWLTHKYRRERHHMKGNMYAPDEREILKRVETFILIGNSSAHQNHSLLTRRHLHFEKPWLYSRAVRGTNFVGVWKGRG